MLRLRNTALLSLFLILTILRPSPINLIGALTSKIIIEAVWFLFTIILYFVFKPKLKFDNLLFVFAIISCTSIILNPEYLFIEFSINDIYEVLLIINYFLIFNLGFHISLCENEFKKVVITPFNIALSLTILITFCSLFSDSFYDFIQNLYFFKSSARYSVDRIRVSGTYTNPNHFSVFLNFAVIFILYQLKNYSSTPRFRVLLLFQLMAAISLILFTGSRTGLIVLFINFFIYLYLNFRYKLLRFFYVILFLILMLFLNFEFLIQSAPQRFKTTFLVIKSGGFLAIDSLRTKFEISKQLVSEVYLNSPFFGFGPSNNLNRSLGDGQIVSTLFKYGFFGLIIFLCFFLSNFSQLRKGKYFKFLPLILLVSFITGEFFYNPQISLIYLILIAIVLNNRANIAY